MKYLQSNFHKFPQVLFFNFFINKEINNTPYLQYLHFLLIDRTTHYLQCPFIILGSQHPYHFCYCSDIVISNANSKVFVAVIYWNIIFNQRCQGNSNYTMLLYVQFLLYYTIITSLLRTVDKKKLRGRA